METVNKIISNVSDLAFMCLVIYFLLCLCGISINPHKNVGMSVEEHLNRIHIVDELKKCSYTDEELQYIIGDDDELRELVMPPITNF